MQLSIKSLLGSVLLAAMPLMFTSCEGTLDDIFGEWDKPAPSAETPSGDGSSTINATAITLDQTMKVIKLGGDALTIKVTFTPSDATDKSVTWTSKDPNIATVENGVVTPKALGITTITAKSGDLTATCEVFVGNEVTLSNANYTANDYDILKGNIGDSNFSIPDGFHVAFDGLNATNTISCKGDATIYLIDGKTNTVTAPENYYAGIQIGGEGTTLTINAETEGTGTLTAKGGSGGAGIGVGYFVSSSRGAITINGGTINATGGSGAAGIGTGKAEYYDKTCGDITINGGTVTAKGGDNAAGIGMGYTDIGKSNTCGAITITADVTSVTSIKGSGSPYSIGKGEYLSGGTQACGTIKIGGEVKAQSQFTGDTYTYTPAP
jgi:hypothetical protein